jgi:hypothetical protein
MKILARAFLCHEDVSFFWHLLALGFQHRLHAECFTVSHVKARRDDADCRLLGGDERTGFDRVIHYLRFETRSGLFAEICGKTGHGLPRSFLCGKLLACFQKEKHHGQHQVHD